MSILERCEGGIRPPSKLGIDKRIIVARKDEHQLNANAVSFGLRLKPCSGLPVISPCRGAENEQNNEEKGTHNRTNTVVQATTIGRLAVVVQFSLLD